MTNDQESRLGMQMTVADYSNENASIVVNLPGFMSNLDILKATNDQINGISGGQTTGSVGITANKSQRRLTLNSLASDTARKLTSFAKLNDNFALLGEIKYSESDFVRFSDIKARDSAKIVYSKAKENLNALQSYGINDSTQAALSDAITQFGNVITAPRMSSTTNAQATKQLVDLFKTASVMLEKLDASVEIVKLTESNFYNGYKLARKVISKGTGKLAVKGTVMDAQNGKPIKGVSVTFTLDGGIAALSKTANSKPDYEKTTAAKGGFNIKSVAAGTYQVSFKKAGYADQTVTVNVNGGEMTVVNIALTQN